MRTDQSRERQWQAQLVLIIQVQCHQDPQIYLGLWLFNLRRTESSQTVISVTEGTEQPAIAPVWKISILARPSLNVPILAKKSFIGLAFSTSLRARLPCIIIKIIK